MLLAVAQVLAAGELGDRVTSLSFTGSYTEAATVPAAMAARIPAVELVPSHLSRIG
ncbi:hypothetical protein AB0B79_03655 [Streptomyces sp. NPDC039022]|uniref:hypothetical protein n=1 Tax=Streptomyces sp. NPDC039022 TaxID=3157091 RepID=UPI0033D51923